MRARLPGVFAVVLLSHCCFSHGEDARPVESANTSHTGWQYIAYPQLKYQATNFLSFVVTPNAEGRVFCLDVTTYSVHPPAMLEKGNVSVHLHRANHEVLDIEEKYRPYFEHVVGASSGMSRDGGMDFSIMAMFPWSTNILADSWFEVRIGTERYWVEIPYGVDQNPRNTAVTNIAGGPPGFDPAIKSLDDHDHVVRWQTVHYDLGWIQDHWYLSLIQSNSFHGESEVVLYREDNKPWDLFSPRTAVHVLHADGTVTTGRCIQLRLPDDSMRRSDTFSLGGEDDGMRSWDQMEIGVDDRRYRILIPSSLYKFRHGHAPNLRAQ